MRTITGCQATTSPRVHQPCCRPAAGVEQQVVSAETGHSKWPCRRSSHRRPPWCRDPVTATETTTLTGHTGPVHSWAISPDGTWLTTTGDDRSVRMWHKGGGRSIWGGGAGLLQMPPTGGSGSVACSCR
ncbi:WD40 repeat domain-containing protein [Streptomyces sp. NRRL B-3648]|uniref:WD40 repeat domain-containing protein n=1 Tax=Streptomyces sp. NRRL B-3648 TaxID=1519493 RepID=UPI002D21E5D1|nr:WD40 repeat domain-containing protein [Streptomyces sp. NRRL B-3648]